MIFNISTGEKIYFGKLDIFYPDDFDKSNFSNLTKILSDLSGKYYSINSVEKIIEEIDSITTNEEFKSVNAVLEEEIVSNRINVNFLINEDEKYVLERINIFGNNVTRESVIRNQLEIDEGDPFNEILAKIKK